MVISEELRQLKLENMKIQRRNEKELQRIQSKIHKMKIKAWIEVDHHGMPYTTNKEPRASAGIAYLGGMVAGKKPRKKSRS